MREHRRAFTLIELMVVISIISLLTSIVLASVTAARKKARDGQRKIDLENIYTSLSLYYDTYGYLPMTSLSGDVNCGGWDYSSQTGACSTSGKVFLPFLSSSEIMSNVPLDPINNGTGDVLSSGTGYAYAYYCYHPLDPTVARRNTLSLGAKLETGGVYWKAHYESGWECKP